MPKKKVVKKVVVSHTSLRLFGGVIVLLLLGWLAYSAYQNYQLENAEPMDSIEPSEPSIGDIIAPIIKETNRFTLIFEDEIPDPVTEKNAPEVATQQSRHQLAIIIDDVGYDKRAVARIAQLPYPIVVAVLPDAPYAKQTAQMAFQHGIPVMLHMPMQTTNPKYQNKMEDFYLHTAMSKTLFTQVFEDALKKVPHVIGVNNHMGSALTADKKSMLWLMELCKKHGLFFIDSRTSATSVGAATAKEAGLPWNERDLFLDNDVSEDGLQHAWDSAKSCIKRNDYCIMLAHPHSETLDFLESHADDLQVNNFVFVEEVLN